VTELLIDIGNTRIKWATLSNGRLSRQEATAHAKWTPMDFQRQVLQSAQGVQRILVVSVASEAVNTTITEVALRTLKLTPEFFVSSRLVGGVTTRYADPWRLGVDRFAAVIGAHARAKNKAVCIVDVGTAMTIDLVDSKGLHRGGAIVPGPDLMVKSLLKSTSGIEVRAQGGSSGRGLFARETSAAIEQGAWYAAAAVVDRAVIEARKTLRITPLLYLTGGASKQLHPLVQTTHVSIPDLVLRGLAVSFGLRVK
jgi:type III pantothenate kinase